MKKNWYKDDCLVELIVSSMNAHFPQPKRSRGISYEEIATKWCKIIPFYLYSKKHWEHGPYGMQLNITEIRKAFNYQYNGRNRWFKWFEANYPLWQVQRLGNQYIGNTNMIPLIPLEWVLQQAEPEELKKALTESLTDETDYQSIDVPIDLLNLERYINSTQRKLESVRGNKKYNKNYTDKLARNFQDAIILQKLALATNNIAVRKSDGYRFWMTPFYYREHVWGRKYGVGAYNLQYMSSQVREAAMGPGYVIDLNSSVFMFYKQLAIRAGTPQPIFTELQEDKIRFRSELAKCLENTNGSDVFKQTLIKKAITSMGFGAKDDSFGAVSDQVRNTEDFNRLKAHPKWRELTAAIDVVQAYVRSEYADDIKAYRKDPSLKTPGGQFSMRKFLAMFYQKYESVIMNDVWQELENTGRDPWLGLHDGIMCKNKPDLALMQSLVGAVNPNASLELKKVEKYQDYDAAFIKQNESDHAQRMMQQEAQAKVWAENNQIKTKTALERTSEINPLLAMQLALQENKMFSENEWDSEYHAGPNTW